MVFGCTLDHKHVPVAGAALKADAPDLQGMDVKTRHRSKLLEAGVPEAWVSSHLARDPLLEHALISAGDGEQEPLHAVRTPRALPPRQHHLRHGRRAAVLHQLSGQTVHPAPAPRGWVQGPVHCAQALLRGPQSASQSPFQVALGTHLWLPRPVLLVSLSLSGTPASVSRAPRPLISVIPTLVRRLCGSRKTRGLGIKLNPAQISSSAILMGWGILDK